MTSSEPEDTQIRSAHQQRMARLASDKQRILKQPPEKALDEILDHPQATALVHSMAEEDMYFLVHETGAEDAMELLSLASNRQWEYLLDLEIWNRDRINTQALGHWMSLLSRADPPRFHHWAASEKYDLLEYYLHEALEIRIPEENEDPGDFPDGFFTHDGVFYVRIQEGFLNAIEDEDDREERQQLIHQLLRHLADEDLQTYQATLLRSVNVMEAESQEEALRFRNVRLAEKGFLPFEEAVGVYAPMRPESVRKRPARTPDTASDADFNLPVPVQHSSMLSDSGIFGTALWQIKSGQLVYELQVEFAALCNQVIAADQQPVRQREELGHVVEKVSAYLGLGLHRLAGTQKPPAPGQSAEVLSNYSLADIFRTGYALAVDLRNRARKWKGDAWYAHRRLALSFWGERLVGFVGGLLLTRPKFFDNYQTGRMYREFETMQDIETAEAALNEITAFDHLLSCMEINTHYLPKRYFITHENLLLTLWAKDRLGQPRIPLPIPANAFLPFFSQLWEQGTKTPRIRDSAKSDFLQWLSAQSGISGHDISVRMEAALENLFSRIAEEYGHVCPADLDPRFVHLFILEKTENQ
jgi:hypothetical protein